MLHTAPFNIVGRADEEEREENIREKAEGSSTTVVGVESASLITVRRIRSYARVIHLTPIKGKLRLGETNRGVL
jgi:hypothetical protein